MIALASAAGQARTFGQPNRRGRDDAQLDPVPDSVGLALQTLGQLADLHHGAVGGGRGHGGLELLLVDRIEEAAELLVHRVLPVLVPQAPGELGALATAAYAPARRVRHPAGGAAQVHAADVAVAGRWRSGDGERGVAVVQPALQLV